MNQAVTSFLVLGSDTDAGKTTFATLWLSAFPQWQYFKPVESGESDTERIRQVVPLAVVHEPLARFREPVAPPLAARREVRCVPTSRQIADALPSASPLLIETFGGPFSPLNDEELQIELLRRIMLPVVLASSSATGAIGRTLAVLQSLANHGIRPAGVVLVGRIDEYAQEQIARHGGIAVFSLRPPSSWDASGVAEAAREQATTLSRLREKLSSSSVATASWPENLWEKDRQCVWHPYTALRDADEPIRIVGALDEFLHLADGRRVIDGISSWWTMLHGHRDPRLMGALSDAARSFDHVQFGGATHPPAIRLAELLLRTAPWGGGRVFYSDNGSTAVEVALKMAYQYWRHRGEPGRTLFVGFENSYHGDTFGAMAVGRDPLFSGQFEPLLFRAERIPLSAQHLDQTLRRVGKQVAAVIVEPLVQGAGGMRMHSPDELRALFDVARSHGVLFIADEVMTGCHRTGTMWAFDSAGIAPDLICSAKTLAGGVMSLAATLVAPELVSAFDTSDRRRTFFHGHSFTAHPLACAIAVKNLEMLLESPPSAPARMEAFWHQVLGPLAGRREIRAVRIRGSIAAIDLDLPGGYLADAGRTMRQRGLEMGVVLRPLGNVLYAMPPFNTSIASLELVAAALRSAVDSVRGQV